MVDIIPIPAVNLNFDGTRFLLRVFRVITYRDFHIVLKKRGLETLVQFFASWHPLKLSHIHYIKAYIFEDLMDNLAVHQEQGM